MQDLSPMVAMGGVRCPKCNEDVVIGMGVYPPKALYAIKYEDLKKKKEEFMELVEKSTMSDQEKENIRKLYGELDVIEPTMVQNMEERIKNDFSGVKLG